MIHKLSEKQQAIILIVTSLNQLNNFLSFFIEKKFIDKKKIYLVLASDTITDQLIFFIQDELKKFSLIEIIDLRRKSIYSKKRLLNIRIFKLFLYYIFV